MQAEKIDLKSEYTELNLKLQDQLKLYDDSKQQIKHQDFLLSIEKEIFLKNHSLASSYATIATIEEIDSLNEELLKIKTTFENIMKKIIPTNALWLPCLNKGLSIPKEEWHHFNKKIMDEIANQERALAVLKLTFNKSDYAP